MKIIGPNDEVLVEKGKLMFDDVICGQCAYGKPRDEWSIVCTPPRPIWERDKFPPVVNVRHKDELADGCECFIRKPEEKGSGSVWPPEGKSRSCRRVKP